MATGYSDLSPGRGWCLRPRLSLGLVVQLFDSASGAVLDWAGNLCVGQEGPVGQSCFWCHWNCMTNDVYVVDPGVLETENGEIEWRQWERRRQERKQVLNIYFESGTVLGSIKF